MKHNQLSTLWNYINKVQAAIYQHDQSFQEKFFPEHYNESTYIADITCGDHILNVKLCHHTDGYARKAEIDSEDFADWLTTVMPEP